MDRFRSNWVLAAALVTLVSGVFAPSVLACGENKFRAGHGLKYQAYKAAVAGTVLVYSSSRRDLAPRVLRKAGHRVVVVDSTDSLQQAMANNSFDVVIVPYATAETVVEQIAQADNKPAVVPVAKGRTELSLAKSRYGIAMSSVSGSREIIGLINTIVATQV